MGHLPASCPQLLPLWSRLGAPAVSDACARVWQELVGWCLTGLAPAILCACVAGAVRVRQRAPAVKPAAPVPQLRGHVLCRARESRAHTWQRATRHCSARGCYVSELWHPPAGPSYIHSSCFLSFCVSRLCHTHKHTHANTRAPLRSDWLTPEACQQFVDASGGAFPAPQVILFIIIVIIIIQAPTLPLGTVCVTGQAVCASGTCTQTVEVQLEVRSLMCSREEQAYSACYDSLECLLHRALCLLKQAYSCCSSTVRLTAARLWTPVVLCLPRKHQAPMPPFATPHHHCRRRRQKCERAQ
jgi:hypothetical protein